MENNRVKLKSNKLIFDLEDDEGNLTGEQLIFQMNDTDLPLRYQELIERDSKNKKWLKMQNAIIDKRQDVKQKNSVLSRNEEDKIKILNEFYRREREVYDLFLGKDGVKKILNGEKFGWDTLEYIDALIEEQIKPHLEINITSLRDRIIDKYGNKNNNAKNVIK